MTDVTRLALALGAEVFTQERDDDVRVILHRDSAGTSIYVTLSPIPGATRRACAHAVSLLWRNDHRSEFGFVVRDTHMGVGADVESRRANKFADALIRAEVPA